MRSEARFNDKTGCSSAPKLEDDSFATAESVRVDFKHLIAILDRRLANLSEAGEGVRTQVLDARDTAIRGLTLSQELVDALRSPGSSDEAARQ